MSTDSADQERRIALASWIANPENPLTAARSPVVAARRPSAGRSLRTLSPAALGLVTGGAPSTPKQEFLVVTMKDCFVSSY